MSVATATWMTALALIGLGLSGCPARPVVQPDSDQAPDRPAREVIMEPLHIGLEPDPELGLTDFDAASLFHEGLRLHEAERYGEALKFFERILSQFPDSRYRSAAAFNAGRCLDLLGRGAEAAERYRLVVDGMPGSKDWFDAAFRLAMGLASLGHHDGAALVLVKVLDRPDLSPADRMDALVLLGEAEVARGELLAGERTFRQALRHFRANEREAYLDPGPAAEAEFRLAELAAGRFLAAPLRLPEAQMQTDLEAKAQLLLAAQAGFLRTMRWGDPEWATAAGYRIGKLYIDLHAAMEAAPTPDDLSAEEVQVYRGLLRERLAVLLRKALKVFEMTLGLAERTRSDNAWTRAARAEMERVEKQVLSQLEPVAPAEQPEPAAEPAPAVEPAPGPAPGQS